MSATSTGAPSGAPVPFEINGSGITAVGSDEGVLVAFAGAGDAKMFRRRAQRMTVGGATEHIEMLVAELNGVRTYVQREPNGRVNVIVSTLDLVP